MTVGSSEQQQRELKLAKEALDALGIQTTRMWSSDRPDVLAVIGGLQIGIEVTEVWTSEADIQRSRDWKRTVEFAQEALYGGPPKITVQVSFANAVLDRKVTAKAIAEIVNMVRLEDGGSVIIERPSLVDAQWWPSCVQSVDVSRWDKISKPHWSVAETGWIQEWGATEVQERVDEKERKVATYLKQCDEVWLLLAATGEHIAGTIDLATSATESPLATSFARVFLHRRFGTFPIEFDVVAPNTP